MAKIMIVEDDVFLREELEDILCKRGYETHSLVCFTSVADQVNASGADLVLLDINLPGKSGFELCREIKSRIDLPILILTSRDQLRDELHALDLGADDYLTKPCRPERLIGRIEKLLDLYSKMRSRIKIGSVYLDLDSYQLSCRGSTLDLTEIEGEILRLLIGGYPEPVSKERLLREVWGTTEFVDDNILQVNIARLRKNLQSLQLDQLIETVRGYGYRLAPGKVNGQAEN